jgi:hypothetical protein
MLLQDKKQVYTNRSTYLDNEKTLIVLLSWFGGHSTSKTPGSIPNPAVKCRRANGTASQDVGE